MLSLGSHVVGADPVISVEVTVSATAPLMDGSLPGVGLSNSWPTKAAHPGSFSRQPRSPSPIPDGILMAHKSRGLISIDPF